MREGRAALNVYKTQALSEGATWPSRERQRCLDGFPAEHCITTQEEYTRARCVVRLLAYRLPKLMPLSRRRRRRAWALLASDLAAVARASQSNRRRGGCTSWSSGGGRTAGNERGGALAAEPARRLRSRRWHQHRRVRDRSGCARSLRLLTSPSLIAVMIGKLGMPVGECIQQYRELSRVIFREGRHLRGMISSGLWRERYSEEVLSREIENVFTKRGRSANETMQTYKNQRLPEYAYSYVFYLDSFYGLMAGRANSRAVQLSATSTKTSRTQNRSHSLNPP
jgi:hypothetical protein